MASDAPKPALQTIGSYDILAKIAEGGMGTVYKGRHRQSGQIVAIKIVPANMARNPVFLKRFAAPLWVFNLGMAFLASTEWVWTRIRPENRKASSTEDNATAFARIPRRVSR